MDKKKTTLSNSTLNNWSFVLILCISLGLAPYSPEPHVWGKIKWVAGGANGMSLIDWGDLIFHGFPWVLLLRLIFIKVKEKPVKA